MVLDVVYKIKFRADWYLQEFIVESHLRSSTVFKTRVPFIFSQEFKTTACCHFHGMHAKFHDTELNFRQI